jgi:hypothetical protein
MNKIGESRMNAAKTNLGAATADTDERPEVLDLFRNLKANAAALERLLKRCHNERTGGIYRFYHQSFKVYALQELTLEIVAALRSLAPDRPLNEWFMRIIAEGTEKTFSVEDNARWLEATRPIVEAFFHSCYFLETAVNSSRDLSAPPALLPDDWAAILYLYNWR